VASSISPVALQPRMGFVQKYWLERKCSYLTEKGLFSCKAPVRCEDRVKGARGAAREGAPPNA
jgi:hypothetical protein